MGPQGTVIERIPNITYHPILLQLSATFVLYMLGAFFLLLEKFNPLIGSTQLGIAWLGSVNSCFISSSFLKILYSTNSQTYLFSFSYCCPETPLLIVWKYWVFGDWVLFEEHIRKKNFNVATSKIQNGKRREYFHVQQGLFNALLYKRN